MNTKDLDEMEKMIRHVEIVLTIVRIIGKNLALLISLSIAATFALCIYNAIAGNIIGSLVSLGFGTSGLIFLVQLVQTRRRHYRRMHSYQQARLNQQQKYAAEAA